MSAPIGPGDWVECLGFGGVGPSPSRVEGEWPRKGGLYRVRRIGWGYLDGKREDGLQLYEVRAWHANGLEGGWPVRNFRPVYRPKADLIESLKAPPKRAPVKQTEDA